MFLMKYRTGISSSWNQQHVHAAANLAINTGMHPDIAHSFDDDEHTQPDSLFDILVLVMHMPFGCYHALRFI